VITTLPSANLTAPVLPKTAPAPALMRCGLCGQETYVVLALSDDYPCCCRHCFRQRVSKVRQAQARPLAAPMH
jgi:hypothetical protein